MKRPALTLVEVVAALALLATVVVSVLVAQAQSMQQIRLADERRQAAEKAETMLTQWKLDNVSLDSADQGSLPEVGWSWQRRVQRDRIALGRDLSMKPPEMLRIRLTVLRERPTHQLDELAAVEWLEPVPRKSP